MTSPAPRLASCFDLAIGNPRFSDRTVRGDDPAGRLGLALHDWFIARSVELLRPGGLAAFVTSRWTMDKSDATARRHLAGMADLLTAVSLPEGSLRVTAGTDVVVDLLFLRRRRPGEAASGPSWQNLAEAVPAEGGKAALAINAYFLNHPAMVLAGTPAGSGPFGPAYTCAPIERSRCRGKVSGAVTAGSSVWEDGGCPNPILRQERVRWLG